MATTKTYSISSNQPMKEYFQVMQGQTATATVSGTWSGDPGSGKTCGAAGNGVPPSAGFPVAGPQWCLCWSITPNEGVIPSPQDVTGWFTSDNQTIDWGGTSPGDGRYHFQINDDNLSDNSGSLTLSVVFS